MKWSKKYLSTKHLLAVLRRQPAHMRHVYAIIFAGAVTVFLASGILYFDYGFWRERYNRTDVAEVTDTKTAPVHTESPSEMMSSFFKEAANKTKDLHASGTTFLGGDRKSVV